MSVVQNGVGQGARIFQGSYGFSCSIWKTMTLLSIPPHYYERAIKKLPGRLSRGKRKLIEILLKDQVAEPTEIDLAIISMETQLGLRGRVSIGEIYRRAQEYGLAICPNQTILELCLSYDFLGIYSDSFIGTNLVVDPSGCQHFFRLPSKAVNFPLRSKLTSYTESVYRGEIKIIFACPR